MTSSDKIARKQRGSQMHKEFQLVRIPRRERIEIERGLREMDFERYYKMRHLAVYEYVDKDGVKHTDELEDHYLPVMLSHGNLAMRSVEHDALMNILGRREQVDAPVVKAGERLCGGCGEVMALDDAHFQSHKGKKDGFQTWCRDCMSEASKRQYSRKRSKKE